MPVVRPYEIKPTFVTFASLSLVHAEESAKLQQHLTLLRAEYVKLQARLQRAEAAGSTSASRGEDNFASRLLKAVANMHRQEKYR